MNDLADITSPASMVAPAANSSTHTLPAGAWVLGHNQHQGVSTLQAGARALLIPSDLTRTLSSARGRIAAQTLLMLGGAAKAMNYASLRPYAMIEVIKRSLPPELEHPVILDPAAGYSPELIWMAEQLPKSNCIELDLPAVIQDKQERLKDFTLPPNLIMEAVDLAVTPLHEALNGRQVDVMIVLASYVPADQLIELLGYLRSVLKPGGVVVAPFVYQPGVDELARLSLLFRRFSIDPVGMVEDEHAVHEIFRQANYHDTTIYRMSSLAKELDKPASPDIEIVGVARC